MIEIAAAAPGHAAAVAELVRSVRFDPATARGEQGYLVHMGTEAEYAARFAGARGPVVALVDGQVGGFLLTATGEELESGALTDDGTVALALRLPAAGFVLVDQIAVHPGCRGLGLAQRLWDAARELTGARRAGAAIMHGPVRNARSIAFFAGRNGFTLVGEVEAAPFRWGYYESRIGNSPAG